MKAKELASFLLALAPEHQELEVMSMEEIWAVQIDPPRIAFVDSDSIEVESGGRQIVALFSPAFNIYGRP